MKTVCLHFEVKTNDNIYTMTITVDVKSENLHRNIDIASDTHITLLKRAYKHAQITGYTFPEITTS